MIGRPFSGKWAIVLATLAVATAILGLVIAHPFSPHALTMATGPEGGAFAEFGDRYREILRRSGVDVQLVRTAGGVDNLARLRDPRGSVSVAFVENGLTRDTIRGDTTGSDPTRAETHLVSLGTVTVEPLWVFLRGGSGPPAGSVAQRLAGKRISVEPEGSSTRVLARTLLALNGMDETSVELVGLPPEQAADALLRGEIDVATMLMPWQSPVIQKLVVADGVVLLGHPRADAYVARYPNLSKVVLPTGVIDLAKNVPSADVPLLAAEASLIVRENLAPGLQYLLLEAASEIHDGPAIFHQAGRFPAPESIDLPLSRQARTFYKSGRPFVYSHLPFWMAGVVERLLIVLIPLFTVFPLIRFVPALYGNMIQRRIYLLYGELRVLEAELASMSPDAPTRDVAMKLERLAKRANGLRVPLGFAQRLFILRSHIAMAQEEVEKRESLARREPPAGDVRQNPGPTG